MGKPRSPFSFSRKQTLEHTTEYKLGVYIPRTYIEPLQHLEFLYYELGMKEEAYDIICRIREYYKDHAHGEENVDFDYILLRDQLKLRIPDELRKKKLKLNLGSGSQKLPGFINIDKYDERADYQLSVQELDLNRGSCEHITAYHFLEHLDILEYEQVINKIKFLMCPGGILEITVPNLAECCRCLVENAEEDNSMRHWFISTIYGRQVSGGEIDFGQFHKNGFVISRLIADLSFYGFEILDTQLYNDNDTPSIRIKAKKNLIVMNVFPTQLEDPTARLRRFMPFAKLRANARNNIKVVAANCINDLEGGVIKPDILVFSEFGEEVNGLINRHKGDVLFVFDHNEDIAGQSDINETLKRVDLVVCCSTVLAEKTRLVNTNIIVIGDCYEDEASNAMCGVPIKGK